jgi:lipopolysaccharide assembly outer membrane protein LptD (OstA)
MRKSPAIVLLAILFAAFSSVVWAQEASQIVVQSLSNVIPGAPVGSVDTFGDKKVYCTNVIMQCSNATLMADSAMLDYQSGEVVADGHVRIEEGDLIWVGEHVRYNYKTHQMQSEQFRTGRPPVFAAGHELQGDLTNKIYTARHAFVTTDDVADPAIRVRASRIKIVPGKYIEMWNAVAFADGVPVFYFPYYRRELGPHANNFNFLPGYRSAYGPFLLGTYTWYLGDAVDGKIHADYRQRRGVGTGPDLDLRLGQWGDAAFKYYYLNDDRPNTSTNGTPWVKGIPEDRQRFYFGYQATPFTNLNVKALVNYQSDPLVLHDFFEGDYRDNPQPYSFTEINRYWDNWSLDAETTPRINNFFDQVERLPDVKLTGFRQQVFNTPLYYESESSAGWYRKLYADTNGPVPANYSASRADTFQQLLLPETFFGWLNITPRVGGRFTYYSDQGGPGGTNDETYRRVLDTGVETSFKASQLWPGATNSFLAIDGLRHVIEPSVTYAYVPTPNRTPSQLPQFDTQSPSLELLPVQLPDYNDIDSIDTENLLRFGLRNTLQTRRGGQLDNLLDWNVLLDWRLRPRAGQSTFNDLYSDLAFRPRSWVALQSQLRYDINGRALNMAFHQLTLEPNETWSWGIGHWYLHNGFVGSTGDSLLTSTMFYRLNDNWGARATHYYNFETGRLQEQLYTVYRDLRSWTGALTFRVINNTTGPTDYTVAFTFSLKAAPRSHLHDDTVQPYHLLGE